MKKLIVFAGANFSYTIVMFLQQLIERSESLTSKNGEGIVLTLSKNKII